MKVRELMTKPAISISPGESVAVAARTLTHYNIGILPVCGSDGQLRGLVTDRDLVTRCIAAGSSPKEMNVGQVMTGRVISVSPDMEVGVAAHLMGRRQIRRLPVVEQGRICGIVSLADLARREQSILDAADALGDVCANLSGDNSC